MLQERYLSPRELSSPSHQTKVSSWTRSVGKDLEYRPDIDGLRAIAILSVIGFHADFRFLRGGFTGVDVFFVISGYLITGIILRELQYGKFSFSRFYARRIRRLFPALGVVLLTTLVLGWLILLSDEFQTLGKDTAAGAVFSSNLLLYYDLSPYFATKSRPLTHLWSLGVEEQFYFLWPTLIYMAWKAGKRWLSVIVPAVIAASFFANAAAVSFDTPAAFYLPWSRLWELALGALLAHLQSQSQSPWPGRKFSQTFPESFRRYRSNIYSLSGTALLAGSFLVFRGNWEFPGFWALIPSAGSALIIAAGPQGWINRHVLGRRSVVFIGLISYPLYLWHWPLLCFSNLIEPHPGSIAVTLTAIVLAFILAALTYKFIELPVRHSAKRPRIVASLCATLASFGIAGCMILIQFIPARSVSQEVTRLMLPASEDWLSPQRKSWTALPPDLIEIRAAPAKTMFIGDSFMQQYYPRIEALVTASGGQANSAVFATRGGCSLPYEFSWAYGRAGCKLFIDKALKYAAREDVDTVVFSSAWFAYFTTEQHGQFVLRRGAPPAIARVKDTIAALRRMNKRVYIVLPSAEDKSFDPRSRIERTLFAPGFRMSDAQPPSKAEVQKRYITTQSILEHIARETGAIIINPIEELCDTVCPITTPDGEPIYHDAGHLRPSYVRANVTYLDETVRLIRRE